MRHARNLSIYARQEPAEPFVPSRTDLEGLGSDMVVVAFNSGLIPGELAGHLMHKSVDEVERVIMANHSHEYECECPF